jgi:hypothetical protein
MPGLHQAHESPHGNEMRSCEAILSEVSVYAHYIQLVKEGLIKALDICTSDYDLKITRTGGQ